MSELDRRGGGTSFLVRLWHERGEAGSEPPARVYIRDLRSGEERYLKDVEGLADYLEGRERAARSDRNGARDAGRGGRRRAG